MSFFSPFLFKLSPVTTSRRASYTTSCASNNKEACLNKSNQHEVIVVTGGSRGIGRHLVEALATTPSYRIAIISKSNQCHSVSSVVNSVVTSKERHKGYQCDVSNSEEVDLTVKRIEEEMGSITTLINCAGIAKDDLLVQLKDADLNAVLSTNLLGTIYMGRAVVKSSMLRNRHGNIINIGSVVGIHGDVGQTAYSTSKSALSGLTKTWSRELGPKGIRVNLIVPGFIETDLTRSISEKKKELILKRITLGRFGKVEHIESAVQFVLRNDYVTGQIIVVDGGLQ